VPPPRLSVHIKELFEFDDLNKKDKCIEWNVEVVLVAGWGAGELRPTGGGTRGGRAGGVILKRDPKARKVAEQVAWS
jgi:hypothetical protein